MIEHIKNINTLYGNASVQIPNSLFKTLSSSIKGKNGKSNIQQTAFAYNYLILTAFLYKYSHYVDIDNGTYIQNNDVKELLGYNRNTKSIDFVIKKNGLLDSIGLTETTKDYPISFKLIHDELINDIPLRLFTTIGDMSNEDFNRKLINGIVKNRNYEIKEPLFLTTSFTDSEYGTLYNYERTHQITLDEFLTVIQDEDLYNTDFLLYGYIKAKCKGFRMNARNISLNNIVLETGIDKSTFYKHLDILEEKEYISVNRKGWQTNVVNAESNTYFWKGIKAHCNVI